jgi:glucokinase
MAGCAFDDDLVSGAKALFDWFRECEIAGVAIGLGDTCMKQDAPLIVVTNQAHPDALALLGGFAGNVALTLGARGGVYIGGGIVPRFADRFFASVFRERFEAKGRFRDYLAAIPTALITDTSAALSGAARAIEQQVTSELG